MQTEILTITDELTRQAALTRGALLLQAGEVVAFPTETVYGLGAVAIDPHAVLKIFTAKARPADNPLIVHVAEVAQLSELTRAVPEVARQLIDAFWPGPLSLVLYKNDAVPMITTGGLPTIVVRMPAHQIALDLIAATGQPIAAPSANRSGLPSPTTAAHVSTDLSGRIPLIIDAGPVQYGLESTVVDCTTKTPTILRPGALTREVLAQVVPSLTEIAPATASTRSPGMKYRHYAPTAPVHVFTGTRDATMRGILEYMSDHQAETVAILWHSGDPPPATTEIRLSADPAAAAPRLFDSLRSLDTAGTDVILVQGYDRAGLGAAIMNRLEKAAATITHCSDST